MKNKQIMKIIAELPEDQREALFKDFWKTYRLSRLPMPQASAGSVCVSELLGHPEPTFDILLERSGDKIVNVIKAVREISGLGLKEAHTMVKSTPSMIIRARPKQEAMEAKDKLHAAGGFARLI